MVMENSALFAHARALGAKRYPIGSIPFTQADWHEHYGSDWFFLLLQKTRVSIRAMCSRRAVLYRGGRKVSI